MVELKSRAELVTMREAGRVVATVLAEVAAAARPGVKLIELDRLAAEVMVARGATSSFRGYHPSWAPTPYPAVLCLSINDAIVHGIPDRRALRAGDLLSIDFGAAIDGLHADAAVSIGIGKLEPAAKQILETTQRALKAGIDAARAGGHLGDIGHAVEAVGRAKGYGIPVALGGHGIGRSMHEEPTVPNRGSAGRGLMLREGLTLAIEPMFCAGGRDDHRTAADGWTVITPDASLAAHFEHTIAITADGADVLTLP
jgi:methionyl aminopeptidase